MKVDPKSIVEGLMAWDRGDEVRSVEMGGMGSGYEQCIQTGVFELLRALQYNADLRRASRERDEDVANIGAFNEMLDHELLVISRKFNLGLSGAQAGAIKNLAVILDHRGWEATHDKAVADRIIYVSKPKVDADAA